MGANPATEHARPPCGTTRGYRAHHRAGEPACDACKQANSRYANELKQKKWTGRARRVNATPVKAHLEQLTRSGFHARRIDRVAGLPPCSASRVLNGSMTMMDAGRARALLAVTAADLIDASRTNGEFVNPAGTRRRLEALATLGYPNHVLAAASGLSPSTLKRCRYREQGHVSGKVANRVAALYDTFCMTPYRPETPRARRDAGMTARNARRHGFAPPLAWEDGTIDDPAAKPVPRSYAWQKNWQDDTTPERRPGRPAPPARKAA